MRVVAIGGRSFVTCMKIAGTGGVVTESADEALRTINNLLSDPNVGLILVSDEYGDELSLKLNDIRSKTTLPIIYEVPAPRSQQKMVDYRALLRRVLGI
ncbi:MAG: V-type ATP synthase subunit F [Aigarchaeota archaeon]|nr:V-type ATP synthase subunit F [Aigarchaeota archaeon]MDW8092458.1 V-type ATP synthase subunit F [Nitrososphaerota archaeon]